MAVIIQKRYGRLCVSVMLIGWVVIKTQNATFCAMKVYNMGKTCILATIYPFIAAVNAFNKSLGDIHFQHNLFSLVKSLSPAPPFFRSKVLIKCYT